MKATLVGVSKKSQTNFMGITTVYLNLYVVGTDFEFTTMDYIAGQPTYQLLYTGQDHDEFMAQLNVGSVYDFKSSYNQNARRYLCSGCTPVLEDNASALGEIL